MIQLTALPTAPALGVARPAGSPLSTTSDFALALALVDGGASVTVPASGLSAPSPLASGIAPVTLPAAGVPTAILPARASSAPDTRPMLADVGKILPDMGAAPDTPVIAADAPTSPALPIADRFVTAVPTPPIAAPATRLIPTPTLEASTVVVPQGTMAMIPAAPVVAQAASAPLTPMNDADGQASPVEPVTVSTPAPSLATPLASTGEPHQIPPSPLPKTKPPAGSTAVGSHPSTLPPPIAKKSQDEPSEASSDSTTEPGAHVAEDGQPSDAEPAAPLAERAPVSGDVIATPPSLPSPALPTGADTPPMLGAAIPTVAAPVTDAPIVPVPRTARVARSDAAAPASTSVAPTPGLTVTPVVSQDSETTLFVHLTAESRSPAAPAGPPLGLQDVSTMPTPAAPLGTVTAESVAPTRSVASSGFTIARPVDAAPNPQPAPIGGSTTPTAPRMTTAETIVASTGSSSNTFATSDAAPTLRAPVVHSTAAVAPTPVAVLQTPAPLTPTPVAAATTAAPIDTPARELPASPSVTITVAALPTTPTLTPDIQPAAQAFAAAMFANSLPEPARESDDAALPIELIVADRGGALQPTPLAVPEAVRSQDAKLDLTGDTWMTSMIDRIESLRDESGAVRETRMKLAPDALGRVEVSVSRDETGQLQVRIAADTAQARAILSDAAPRLAEMAEARGLRLGGSSVDAGTSGHDGARREAQAPTPVVPQRPARSTAATHAAPTTTDSRIA